MRKGVLTGLTLVIACIVSYQFVPVEQVVDAVVTTPDYISKAGTTVKDRVLVPEGFKRVSCDEGSFQAYVQGYVLKPYGAKVINFDGSHYFNQLGHVGILELPVPRNGLQQCADALIRIRSEYLWSINQKDKIGFKFTSGHYCSWLDYAKGIRPKVDGSQVTFTKTAAPDASKENFYNYLNLIFMYSGTLSLNTELPKVEYTDDLQIGDMLIAGGSPGHVVMIADVIENAEGERRFLLLQGNTPAQSVHLLKNLEHTSASPWYELKMDSKVSLPGYTFYNSRFVRFK